MKKKYIKPMIQRSYTVYGGDMMQATIQHSYDEMDAKDRDDVDEDEIGERPGEFGPEPMSLW